MKLVHALRWRWRMMKLGLRIRLLTWCLKRLMPVNLICTNSRGPVKFIKFIVSGRSFADVMMAMEDPKIRESAQAAQADSYSKAYTSHVRLRNHGYITGTFECATCGHKQLVAATSKPDMESVRCTACWGHPVKFNEDEIEV